MRKQPTQSPKATEAPQEEQPIIEIVAEEIELVEIEPEPGLEIQASPDIAGLHEGLVSMRLFLTMEIKKLASKEYKIALGGIETAIQALERELEVARRKALEVQQP